MSQIPLDSFHTHIIIPIVDDFLLYHKDNEKYEKQTDKVEAPKTFAIKSSSIHLKKTFQEELKELGYSFAYEDRLDVIINKKGKFQTIRRMKPVGVSQEFGNAHVSPHPFLRPALENNIDRITSRLGQAIWSEIQWGKYNNDKSKG